MSYRVRRGLPNRPPPTTRFNISTEYPTNQRHNIYHIAYLLRQKLVPDVVPAILDYAEVFEKSTNYTGDEARPMVITQHMAPHTTLVTTPVNSPLRLQHPVRKVVFVIKSCDQGWASNPDGGSWTWFTAGVYPKDQSKDDNTDSGNASGDKPNDRFLTREREIFRNDVASKDMKTHIVEWSVDSDNEEEQKWLEALENGDRIALRAWAQFSGWQNNIQGVSVAVYTAALI